MKVTFVANDYDNKEHSVDMDAAGILALQSAERVKIRIDDIPREVKINGKKLDCSGSEPVLFVFCLYYA